MGFKIKKNIYLIFRRHDKIFLWSRFRAPDPFIMNCTQLFAVFYQFVEKSLLTWACSLGHAALFQVLFVSENLCLPVASRIFDISLSVSVYLCPTRHSSSDRWVYVVSTSPTVCVAVGKEWDLPKCSC